jgi:NAD(P)-dependent dehydrogenase (short-subunit alcohol dehydrogenase family)
VIVDFVVADITKENECQRIVESAMGFLGGLTTVVNAAGVLQGGAMGSVGLDNYKFNVSANCQAPFEIMMHSIPYLKKQKGAYPSVINVSSVNGKQAFAACAAYCMCAPTSP